MSDALITVRNLNWIVENKTILTNINLVINKNTITTIIGPNGGGKSSLIKVILGLIQPSSGEIIKHVDNLKIGYLPQKLNFDQSIPLTVDYLLKLSPYFNQKDYEWLIENCDLAPILKSSIHLLSGGERQRAFLARALLQDPQLLVLDEPAQGVDINRQVELYKLINKVKQRFNCAVLLVSHDLNLVMKNTDSVVCLNQTICCTGEPRDIVYNDIFAGIFGHIVAKNLQDEFAIYYHGNSNTHHY